MSKKTEKCKRCGRRFRLHDWQNSFERKWCMTCTVKLLATCKVVLTPREQKVIYMRFGLREDKGTKTLEEVGQEFGVTRERVRQIEAKAFSKVNEMFPINFKITTNINS